jgi:hypothetical protein
MPALPSIYEQQLIEIVRTLPPSSAEEVLDFALFIQAKLTLDDQPVNDVDESSEAVLADEARWDEQFAASGEKLRAVARKARDNFYAGKTTAMTAINGELAPVAEE